VTSHSSPRRAAAPNRWGAIMLVVGFHVLVAASKISALSSGVTGGGFSGSKPPTTRMVPATFSESGVTTGVWPPDMSGAKAGDVVVMSGNLWLKLSVDGGKTFSDVKFNDVFSITFGARYTEEKIAQMRASAGRAYAVSFVCYVVMALAMSILIGRMDVRMIVGGVKLGAVLGIGFAATLSLTANMFSEKRLSAWLIDAGYQIAYLILMGVILVAWRS